ncbi:hypothetical protein HA466_0075630 [Hirschfeldia incana]|nr:hypothetical protein HA466_0282410 [Hirschfeldia incana]KAJ0258829.1 hypothetical protein HA466_0075630 [Hirschfeldia incana]
MGGKLRKTTDAVVEILVAPCSRGGLWRAIRSIRSALKMCQRLILGTDFDFSKGYLQEHHFLFLLLF